MTVRLAVQDLVESSCSGSEASAPELTESESEIEPEEQRAAATALASMKRGHSTSSAPQSSAAAISSSPIIASKGSADVLWRRRPTDKFEALNKTPGLSRDEDRAQISDEASDTCWELRTPVERAPTLPPHIPDVGAATLPRSRRSAGAHSPLRIFDILWPAEQKYRNTFDDQAFLKAYYHSS